MNTTEAEKAYLGGNLAEATRLAQEILNSDPDHVPALHLLRVIANRNGDIGLEAQLLTRILDVDQDHVESLHGLASIRRKEGNLSDAVDLCLRALAAHPNYAIAWNTLGLCYASLARYQESAEAFENAIKLQPNLAAAYVNLGSVLQRLSRKQEAATCFQRAIEIAPNSAEAYESLGLLLQQQKKRREALDCFRKVLEMKPKSPQAYLLMARAFSIEEMGDTQASIEYTLKAIELDPSSARAYSDLGFALLALGDFPQARSSFERSILLQPVQGDGFLGLATSKKMSEQDRPFTDQIVELLKDSRLNAAGRAHLYTALSKAFDDMGDYGQAMAAMDAGTTIALKQEGITSPIASLQEIENYVKETVNTFTPVMLRERNPMASETELPLLIVGLPRSGTTLMEQILSSHPQVAAGGELRYWGDATATSEGRLNRLTQDPVRAAQVVEEYLTLLRRIGKDAALVTDKMPDNFFHMGFIHWMLPKARFIHCRRNPLDNCVSLYLTPFRKRPPFAYTRESIVRYYRSYRRLAEYWDAVLPSDRILTVDYEDVIADREVTTRKILDFCGLEWDEACLHPEENKRSVNTPSKWQTRQAVYGTSVERWRRYEPWLGALKNIARGKY